MAISETTEAREALERKIGELRRTILRPPTRMTLSSWADAYRYLSPEASAEVGRWRTSRAEFTRGIMDAFSDPSTETVVVQAGSQLAKTECLLNLIGFQMALDPAPIMVVQPRDRDSEKWSKKRLMPMLRDTPAL